MTRSPAQDSAAAGQETVRARSSAVLAAFRLTAVSLYSLFVYPAFMLPRLGLGREERIRYACGWAHRWFQFIVRTIGLNIRVDGEPPAGAVVLTPNHLGYADIIALGSLAPWTFVAKADMVRWPIIGMLLRQARQIPVDRRKRAGVAAANAQIEDRLRSGAGVCVFLEGTSSGGSEVRPFHASLLAPAVALNAPVIPVAIHWSADDPGISVPEDIAYWKGHVFAPHLWRFLGLRGLNVRIAFGKPIHSGDRDRKELAAAAHENVVYLLRNVRAPSG